MSEELFLSIYITLSMYSAFNISVVISFVIVEILGIFCYVTFSSKRKGKLLTYEGATAKYLHSSWLDRPYLFAIYICIILAAYASWWGYTHSAESIKIKEDVIKCIETYDDIYANILDYPYKSTNRLNRFVQSSGKYANASIIREYNNHLVTIINILSKSALDPLITEKKWNKITEIQKKLITSELQFDEENEYGEIENIYRDNATIIMQLNKLNLEKLRNFKTEEKRVILEQLYLTDQFKEVSFGPDFIHKQINIEFLIRELIILLIFLGLWKVNQIALYMISKNLYYKYYYKI